MIGLKIRNLCELVLVLFLSVLFFDTHLSEGSHITTGQSLSGNRTISSEDGTFELGFFTPGKSQNYYIGIWYKRFHNKTVVWVANRNHPISNHYISELKLLPDGNLVLLNESSIQIWTTNSTLHTAKNSTTAILLNNGNVVIRDNLSSSDVIWQSFDYPTDHWLPGGGKIGYNKIKKEKVLLTPWKNSEDPAPSLFSLEVETNGTSHILVYNRTKVYWSSGAWTRKHFALVPEMDLNFYITNLSYTTNENESKYTYDIAMPNTLTRFMIDVTGQLRQFIWNKNSGELKWSPFWVRPQQCEVYRFCGAFSSCNQVKAPLCNCMSGYQPRLPQMWELEDYTDGCMRMTPLKCGIKGTDKFLPLVNSRLSGDSGKSESLNVGSAKECEIACLKNCSCNAYVFDNGKCLVWKGEVYNLQQLAPSDRSGNVFHLKIAKSEKKKKTAWIIAVSIGGFLILVSMVVVVVVVVVVIKKLRKEKKGRSNGMAEDSLIVFKYKDIRNATKDFSEKLGEGGFGSVFKGTLPNSGVIAVKRLKNLRQGEKQFRAEVSTIGLIQHINLIRLQGFCIEGTKRFLVFDYMKNGSLENSLFPDDSAVFLDWKARYSIMIGTANGLSYLHEKCRDCIIHCDIKPENILLDDEFRAKVADFGLAKLLGREFSRVLTTIRGTRGYLAPEWISGVAITAKADVFSYGMLLFEIISGKRNRNFSEDGTSGYFPARVAQRINEGEEPLLMDFIDKKLQGEVNIDELTRACKVACWCIQDDEKDRPSMGLVVQILEGLAEVGNHPPIPQFLKCFLADKTESLVYQDLSYAL